MLAANRELSQLTDLDLHLFHEGSHNRLYQKFGAHTGSIDGRHSRRQQPNFRCETSATELPL